MHGDLHVAIYALTCRHTYPLICPCMVAYGSLICPCKTPYMNPYMPIYGPIHAHSIACPCIHVHH